MNPKAFISYSWSSLEHAEWVLRLATELREAGVDAILDKWDLNEGDDAHAFMERMVVDPTIGKVIIVCDRLYAEKADGRSGGVGTETQIITPELYGKEKQNKFVAVITECDDDGKPYLPTFYKSRIFIDLSSDSAYSEGFERLLRWALGRPLHVKPELGPIPNDLAGDEMRPKLATGLRHRRALEALQSNRPNATAMVLDYFDSVTSGLENFRIKTSDYDKSTFDDVVIGSIKDFLPYRDECIGIFLAIASHCNDDDIVRVSSQFFEAIIPFLDRPGDVSSWDSWDFDNFKFISHELFLYFVAILVKRRRYEAAGLVLAAQYFVRSASEQSSLRSYQIFMNGLQSLDFRKSRLKLNRTSLQFDLLKERCIGVGVAFDDLIQADFVLFLRAKFNGLRWFPVLAVISSFRPGPCEIFVRAKSASFFAQISKMLGVPDDPAAFRAAVKGLASNQNSLPRVNFDYLAVQAMSAAEEIGILP